MTIIIMLILVGVTVNVALNGGLFETAQKAGKQTEKEADRETLQAGIIGAIDTETLEIPNAQELENNLPEPWTVDGTGPYTVTSPNGNTFIVTKDGEIKENKNLTTLEKYILGEDGEGRDLFEIEGTPGILNVNPAGGNGPEFSFINVPEELQNGGLTFKTYALVEISEEMLPTDAGNGEMVEYNGFIIDMYCTYNNETYKFRTLVDVRFSSGKSLPDIGVKDISYDQTTKVGKTVKYDNKNWVILYDDAEHGLQMISEEPLQKNNSNIVLGYNDPTLEGKTITAFAENKTPSNLNLEKAVYSYNNAVTTLNSICDELVSENGKISSVRSVGSKATGDSNEDKVEMYTQKEGDANTNLLKWPENSSSYAAGVGNGKGKTTDLNYEEDYDRMVALGINTTEKEYWLASRVVHFYPGDVYFGVRSVDDGVGGPDSLWRVFSSNANSDDPSYAVRPVVSLSSNALEGASGEGTAENPFILN